MVDWGDGEYEVTAADLWAASERVIAAAGVAPSEAVLDLACGTGNAALLAARAGAVVTGVDPAVRLLEVASERLDAEGRKGTFLQGEAGAIPVLDRSFDVVVSVFGVIFAPDAGAAVGEMVRVLRPGGRVVLTSWLPSGTIAQAGGLLQRSLAAAVQAPPYRPAAWGDPAFARSLLESHGASVAIHEEALTFEADSPAAWFDTQAERHPVWRMAHRALASHPGAWDELRTGSIALLSAGNEDPSRFRTTSRYLLIRAVMPVLTPAGRAATSSRPEGVPRAGRTHRARPPTRGTRCAEATPPRAGESSRRHRPARAT